MRTTTKRRAGQLALVTVAAPVAAWALEQAARRAEAGDQTSSTSRRLRQGADLVQRFGRGPLADRLRQWLADGHGRRTGFAASAAATPRVDGRAIRRTRAFGVPGSDPWR
jgi:2-succinyl-5-enolpyruvyl-6-hydroxy-3-cyclohexene-1-carboxylate synthase